jgi:hypothetical protein
VAPSNTCSAQPLTTCLKVSDSKTTIRWILTPAAKKVILRAHAAGLYGKDRLDAREPPYMAPSTNPEDYSKVCYIAASTSIHDV